MKKRTRPLVPFAQILNSLLKERSMGIREAARIAGVPGSTIMSWRSGALPENYLAVARLARSLGVSFAFILTGEEEPHPSLRYPTITEVFDDGEMIFDGYAKISIHRIIPKIKGPKKGGPSYEK